MSTAKVDVQVKGLEEVSSLLKALKLLATDTTEVLDDMALITMNKVRERFLATKAPDGSKWPVSAGAILRASAEGQTVGGKTYKDGATLFMSGKLFHSMQVRKPSEQSRAIYTNMHYASYHNEGTKKMPQRTFLGIAQQDVDTFLLLINNKIKDIS